MGTYGMSYVKRSGRFGEQTRAAADGRMHPVTTGCYLAPKFKGRVIGLELESTTECSVPFAVGRAARGQTAGIRVEALPDTVTHGQQVGQSGRPRTTDRAAAAEPIAAMHCTSGLSGGMSVEIQFINYLRDRRSLVL